jgi:hypothetical protein
MRRVRELLTQDAPGLYSADLDQRLRAEFKGLVQATLVPPQGWTA